MEQGAIDRALFLFVCVSLTQRYGFGRLPGFWMPAKITGEFHRIS
jgi:hypothetical protein